MKALILNLGGTIGMVNSPEGLRPPASDSEFRKVVEGITAQYPDVEFDFETPFPPKDSTDVTPADWEKFSNRLMAAQRDYDFIICTHGTDTMAQTAMATTFGFLAKNGQDEVVNTQTTPVIFTGAQHPIFAEKSDAPDNLECAIETGIKAAQEGVADVLAVFHGRVMRGVNARKVSDVALDAYHSINGEYAGHFDSNGLHFTGEMRRIKPAEKAEITVQAEALTPLNRFQLPKKTYIETLLVQPGASAGSLWNIARDKACLGTIFVVLGAGNVPDTLTKTVNEAAHNYHFPMFAVSPFPGGNANPSAYAAGSRAFEAGVTFLGNKAPPLAYVTAHWLISNGLARTASEFSKNMQKSWVSETKAEACRIPAVLETPARIPNASYKKRLEDVLDPHPAGPFSHFDMP